MPKPRYTDKWDDPLYDRYDDLAGDYDLGELSDGFHVDIQFDGYEDDDDDDN